MTPVADTESGASSGSTAATKPESAKERCVHVQLSGSALDTSHAPHHALLQARAACIGGVPAHRQRPPGGQQRAGSSSCLPEEVLSEMMLMFGSGRPPQPPQRNLGSGVLARVTLVIREADRAAHRLSRDIVMIQHIHCHPAPRDPRGPAQTNNDANRTVPKPQPTCVCC